MKAALIPTVAILAALAAAPQAFADRFVVLGASDDASYVANIDARSDQPDGVTRYEIEIGRYRGRQASYEIVTAEANCTKGQLRMIKFHQMTSPTFEAAPPRMGLPEWTTPPKGSLEAGYLQAGCSPSFPKASVIDTGDGDHDYRVPIEAALKAHLGLKPTDPLPTISRRGGR